MLGTPHDRTLPEDCIAWICFGTTVATTALLEHAGASSRLLITECFCDLLEIRTQERPDLFALALKKSQLLYCKVRKVPEQINANGVVVCPIDLDVLHAGFKEFSRCGIESVAIVYLHA